MNGADDGPASTLDVFPETRLTSGVGWPCPLPRRVRIRRKSHALDRIGDIDPLLDLLQRSAAPAPFEYALSLARS